MSLPGLLLVGAGGHARACVDVIEGEGRFRIAGLVGTAEERNRSVFGYPVLGVDDDLPALAGEYRHALVALGQIRSPEPRIRLYRLLAEIGFELPGVVANDALVSRHAEIGPGSIVMRGAIINAGARVGANCIINSRALVEHDARIGDHCHVSTGAVVNGGASVGEGSFVGSGSILREGIVLGRGCLIGMGLSVRHDQPDHARILAADAS